MASFTSDLEDALPGWCRHDGMHLRAPGFEQSMEFLDFSPICRRQIPGFAGILAQIVKLESTVFIPFDELPIFVLHSAGGSAALIAIMRIMPKKRPPFEASPLK